MRYSLPKFRKTILLPKFQKTICLPKFRKADVSQILWGKFRTQFVFLVLFMVWQYLRSNHRLPQMWPPRFPFLIQPQICFLNYTPWRTRVFVGRNLRGTWTDGDVAG